MSYCNPQKAYFSAICSLLFLILKSVKILLTFCVKSLNNISNYAVCWENLYYYFSKQSELWKSFTDYETNQPSRTRIYFWSGLILIWSLFNHLPWRTSSKTPRTSMFIWPAHMLFWVLHPGILRHPIVAFTQHAIIMWHTSMTEFSCMAQLWIHDI